MEDAQSINQNVKVLVVYPENGIQNFNEDVLQLLNDNAFKCVTLENDGMPNYPVNKNFIDLAKTAEKLLFIISNEFKSTTRLQSMSVLATEILPSEHIVCLFKDCDIHLEGTLSCLLGTNLVHTSSDESHQKWTTTLLNHLSYRRPDYSHLLGPAKVLCDCDFHHIHLDEFAIALIHNNERLRIDPDEFKSHIDGDGHHHSSRSCDECLKLCPEGTTISVVYNDYLAERPNKQEECLHMTCEISKVWNRLSNIKEYVGFPIACNINGSLRNFKFVRTLFIKFFFQICFSTHVPNDQYNTEESRIASFPSSWSEESVPKAEQLAKAGFYYKSRPHVTVCFCCGVTIFDWSSKDNPLHEHAGRCGTCPFIVTTLSEDTIKRSQDSCINNEYKINERYSSFESRKQSCETFNSNMKFDANKVNIDEMSMYGFYFTGIGLLFACFACGLVLPRTAGNIKTFHAKFSPTCSFMNTQYGKEYIRDICSASDNESSRSILSIFPVTLSHLESPQSGPFKHFFMFIPSKAF